jgi:hypothetical protein
VKSNAKWSGPSAMTHQNETAKKDKSDIANITFSLVRKGFKNLIDKKFVKTK